VLVSSSQSSKEGPFEQAAWIMLLIVEAREVLKNIVFEASTSTLLVD
jgi:hypothetical protein